MPEKPSITDDNTNTPLHSSGSTKKGSKLLWWVREAAAIFVWTVIVTKAFLFDIDIALVLHFPWLWPLIKYRLVLVLPVAAVVIIASKNQKIRRNFLYIALYPFVLFFARLLWPALKNWPTLIVFAPGIYSMLLSFKWRLILNSLVVLAAFSILVFSNPFLLMFSVAVLLCFICIHCITRVWHAFRPTNIFARVGPFIDRMWRQTIARFETKDLLAMRKLDPASEEYQKQHLKNLKELYTNNLMWRYLASRLGTVVASRRMDLYFLGAASYTAILTLTLFGLIYFGVYKIDPLSFKTAGPASFWTFMLFSFNAILRAGFATVTPVSTSAILLTNFELLAGLFIAFFVVSILFTSHRERYRNEIESTIRSLKEGADHVADFILAEFQMTMLEAEEHIVKEDPEFSGTIKLGEGM